MRVTNKMLSNSFLYDMNNNLQSMQTVQQQLSSGKEISKPSDDPFKVARTMQLNSDIDANTQYNSNIQDTANWLDTTDTALGQAGNVLQRVRELLVSSGNAAYGSQERQSIKDEINQNVNQFAQVLNTNFDGKYIFGGTRGTTKPMETISTNGNNRLVYYSNNAADPETDIGSKEYDKLSSKMSVEISQGVSMNYNVSASDVVNFKSESGADCDIRSIFTKLINHLDGKSDDGTTVDANAVSKLTGNDLTAITDSISNLLKVRSETGAKSNRIDAAKDSNEQQNFNMTELLSKTEDIDITQKTMEYATAQTVYTAALQTSAKVLQPSLLDYLR